MRMHLAQILLILVPCMMGTVPNFAESQPNILLILSDDQGFGDVSAHGNPVVETPALDALARESVELVNFHAAPLCSPTRASLMTGKQFLRTGVWGVHGGRDYMDLRETTIAQRLQAAGYRTAMAGKWHLGKTSAYLPCSRGFDEAWAITGRLYAHQDPIVDHNGKELRPRGWTSEILTGYLLDWIGDGSGQPFFAYLAHPYIHEPLNAPSPLITKYREKGLSDSFATLCAMTEHLDTITGRLLEALAARGLDKNTVVIFLGDNGPIGPHLTDAEMAVRNPAGLRGVKSNLYENGMRAPCFVRWPGNFPPRASLQEVDVTDLVPTMLDLAGVPFNPAEFDGVSMAPLLSGTAESISTPIRHYANHELDWDGERFPYDFLHDKSGMAYDKQTLGIRDGDLKLVMIDGREQLFNIASDPTEKADLKEKLPQEATRLRDMLKAWWTTEVFQQPHSYAMPVFPLPRNTGDSILLHPCSPTKVLGQATPGSHFSHDWKTAGDGIVFSLEVPDASAWKVQVDWEVASPEGTLFVSCKDRWMARPIRKNKSHILGTIRLEPGLQFLEVSLRETTTPSVKIKALKAVYLTRLPAGTPGQD